MNLDDIFSPGGVLSKALDSYSFRDDQLEMAQLVEEGFKDSKHIVVEAGTGIGKSFAYLVPALSLVQENPEKKVIIATSTLTLERQLYDKDIPIMMDALGIDLPVSILFGRGNYLCMRKYHENYMERSLLSIDPDTPEARMDKWVKETNSGCRVDVPTREIGKMIENLLSDSEDCMGSKCPYLNSCFFYKARNEALRSSIVVTNHHILLYDAKIRAESGEDFTEDVILPGYTHAIVDEAHHIEDEATEVLSDSYSHDKLNYILDQLTRKQGRFGNMSLLEYLSPIESPEMKGFSKRAVTSIGHIRTVADQYDSHLESIISKEKADSKGILFTSDFFSRNRESIMRGEALAEDILRLSDEMSIVHLPDENYKVQLDLFYLYMKNLKYYHDVLRDFMRFSDFENRIPYAVLDKSGKYEIRLAPMMTGPILSRTLLSNLESLLYCSATLTVDNSFEYFAERSGLYEEKNRLLQGCYESPFNYPKTLMYLIPRDGRSFAKENTKAYNDYVARVIADSLRASGGGALVLFTSKMMLKDVYNQVSLEIGDELELLKQDDRGSKSILLNKFKSNIDSSLFATSSFWEGVDAPGDTLRLVIIVKLPFSVPSEPVYKARENHININENGRAFIKLTVPQAIIKLKQGIGRLIRSEEDRGVVMILDNRILLQGYGRMMINSLPKGYDPEDSMLSNLPDKIERFLF